MINFPCKCGHLFNLTEDMAGGLTQCPRCGLLCDVPSLNDLSHMNADGTIRIEDAAALTDEITLADLQEAFTNKTTDSAGREKDLRQGDDHFRSVGAIPFESERAAPKYDPITGELVRPLDIKQEEPRPVLPAGGEANDPSLTAIPALPVTTVKSIGYAVGDTLKHVTPLTLFLELLMPANAFVIFFVFIFYFVAAFLAVMLAVASLFFQISLQVLNIPFWLILAHYASVIEETGPENRDELPRPLRNLGLAEDIWNPFVRVVIALVICYFPAVLVTMPWIPLGSARLQAGLLLQLLGSFFFPAVLLTSVTSGTITNLRPDRVLSVIGSCGAEYLFSVAVFLLAILPTMFAIFARTILMDMPDNVIVKHADNPYVLLPLLCVSVYLMHYFCWHLGLLYRAHHDSFPWVMQRHIAKSRAVKPR